MDEKVSRAHLLVSYLRQNKEEDTWYDGGEDYNPFDGKYPVERNGYREAWHDLQDLIRDGLKPEDFGSTAVEIESLAASSAIEVERMW